MSNIEKVTLRFDEDKQVDLNFDNDSKLQILMLKGDDGYDPKIESTRNGKVTTVKVTDYYGEKSFEVKDGFDPTVTTSRKDKTTTINITDVNGTRSTEIYDGTDLTGGVPTNGVIGWTGEGKDIPNGYELSDESFDYTSLTNKPQINGVELSGNKTSKDLGITIPTPKTTKTTSDTDTYSCNYVNNIANSQNIVESGDGYIKYSDGTMICYGNYSGTTKLSEYFNWCKRTEENISVTFKKEFLSAPTVVITPHYFSYVFSIMINQIKTTGFGFTGLKTNGAAIDTSVNIYYIALGKWK